ncbi:AMP-binding protein [Teichococcus vastitatis]|uniref:AMP-binding protein n=1 Tax=Teichococcus vastitatis TaxID=2307076 RepID=A0ABS9W408_9PROT|nr:AMP-binding protein [Pseudoroseomonas vastitatis]MCI0754008.1 AMP-binding protein [Pseudoroseomonas vastitatis]
MTEPPPLRLRIGSLPLTNRPEADVLFRRRGEAITVGRFLADVAALAARLPARSHALNLCADRYNALLAFAAALSRDQVVLLSSDRSDRRLAEIAAAYPDLTVMADAETEAVGGEARWEPPPGAIRVAPLAVPGRGGPNPAIPSDRVAVIGFTSGSTGRPAAHPKSWAALVAAAVAAGERFALRDGTDMVATVPPQHMYGFETTIMLPLHVPTTSHAGPCFYPVEVAEALQAAAAPRVLVTTPLQLRALLGAAQAMPSVAAVISATAPLDPALAAAVEAAWNTRVLEIYGATEMGSIASRRTVEGESWTLYRSVALRPAEGVPDGTEAVVAGMAAPVPLADAVALEGEGRFRLLGRRTDIVKLGGKRASLASLNRILLGIPGVADGVFAVPDDLDRNPAARLAVFAVAPGLAAETILAALRREIEPVFLPRSVTLVPCLPRDAVGKLPRAALDGLRRQVVGLA